MMNEYLISTGILLISLSVLYSLYDYFKYMSQYDKTYYDKSLKNKLVSGGILFVKTGIVFIVFVVLVQMIKITIFG